jgi:REP element-mobilizing transposase RayT
LTTQSRHASLGHGALGEGVAAGIPHHVTQRGNRRQRVFCYDEDYRAHAALLAESRAGFGVAVWGYRLMPDHVHLTWFPGTRRDGAGLRAALGEAHRRYELGVSGYPTLITSRPRIMANLAAYAPTQFMDRQQIRSLLSN